MLGKRNEVRIFLSGLAEAAGQEALGFQQIGDFWLHRGEWAAARGAYETGMAKHQGNRPEYIGRLAEWHLVQGQNKQARELVEKESKRYPESALLDAYVAAVRLGEAPANRRIEERRRLESILAKMPDSPFVRYHLGRAYLMENRVESAAEQFERSIKLDANYAAGWMALAEIELARGNPALAEARANSAMQAGENIVPALLLRAKSQAVRGKFSDARKSLESVLSLDPANMEARFWQANTLAAQGKPGEAAAIFAQGRQAEPANPRWILAEAASQWSAGKTQESRKLLEEAAKLFPNQQTFEERLGDVQLSLRDAASARQTFEKLSQAQPKNVNYQLGLAASHALGGAGPKALEIYANLQKQYPDNQRVWLEPAALLDEMGRGNEAIAAYRHALERNKANPLALNNLAWRLLQQGKDLEQALELAQNAKRLLQRAPEIDGTLAEAYTRLAMHRNAAAIYEEMLGYVDSQNKPRIQKLLEASRKRSSTKGRTA
jgi:cellulose synthase operon protein C